LAACSVLLYFLSTDIAEPFWGLHDFNSADHGQFARVILRFPVSMHRFLPTYALGREPTAVVHHYIHHPPLISSLVALSMAIFGDHEWAVRLVPIACSLASLLLLMRLLRERYDEVVAVLGGLLFAILPIGAYFGRMANHEAPMLCFSLLAIWGWNGLRNGPMRTDDSVDPASIRAGHVQASRQWLHPCATPPRRIAFITGMFLALYSGWAAVLVVAGIGADALIRRRVITRGALLTALLPPMFVLGVLYIHLVGLGGGGRWDLPLIVLRARVHGDGADAIPFRETAKVLLENTELNFTWPGIALIAAGLLASIRQLLKPSGRTDAPVATARASPCSPGPLWILALAGAAYLGLIHQARIHHYWWFMCWPAGAMFGAIGLLRIKAWATRIHPVIGRVALAGLAVVTAWFAVRNTEFCYAVVTPLEQEMVLSWQRLKAEIGPDAAIQLGDPLVKEQNYGGVRHWWWGRPASAYYLDRPCVYSATLDDIRARASAYPWLAIWRRHADERGLTDALKSEGCREIVLGAFVLFDLSPLARPAASRETEITAVNVSE
jgi:hypothetical protein